MTKKEKIAIEKRWSEYIIQAQRLSCKRDALCKQMGIETTSSYERIMIVAANSHDVNVQNEAVEIMKEHCLFVGARYAMHRLLMDI